MSAETVEGGCYCGAVRFRLGLPVLFNAHCHCSMCRRLHTAGFVTWVGVPYERFAILSGDPELIRYRSSEHGMRSFCRRCGSAMLCESTRHPEYLDITLASIDGDVGQPPGMHVHFSDRASWVHVADGLPRAGGASGIEPLGA